MVHSRQLTAEVLASLEQAGDVEGDVAGDVGVEGRVEDAMDGAATLPGGPAPCVDDDDELAALVAHVEDARAFLQNRAWDNLAHIERFAAGAVIGARVIDRFGDDGTRRRVVSMLWPLLPVSARVRDPYELPAAVDTRAPAFVVRRDDVPNIAARYCDFLAPLPSRPDDLVDELFQPGSGPFLAARALCPGAARGACTAVVLAERGPPTASTLTPRHTDGARQWRCAVSRAALGLDGDDVRVRVGPDGQPLLGVDGREQPITVSDDALAAWLFSAGPDARGLDLRSEDDRCLLLCWSHALRGEIIDGKSAFAWLQDDSTALATRVRVVERAITCAIDVVARFAIDALACRITLRSTEGDGGWTRVAGASLDASGLGHDVTARGAADAREVVWLDAFLRPGFAGGRLTPLAAGRAFARLATSVLAPLGVLPLSGLRDGSGAVLLQRLVETHAAAAVASDPAVAAPARSSVLRAPPRLVSFHDSGARDELLFGVDGAWAAGRGLALPDPKGSARHDVTAMPAWLACFLEGLA